MAREPVTILGVDTSLRSSGVGIISSDGIQSRAVSYGVIKNPQKWPVSRALANIADEMEKILEETQPDLVAVEGVFYCRNAKTALALGQARGVVIAACAKRGLPIYEYAPRSVKKGIVGGGSASKDQVAQMIKKLLTLPEIPPEDAADALAIALCHAHHLRLQGALEPPSI